MDIVKQTIRNEFAVVQIAVRTTDRGAMALTISEPESGDSITLDALELEALTHASHEFFRRLLTWEDHTDS